MLKSEQARVAGKWPPARERRSALMQHFSFGGVRSVADTGTVQLLVMGFSETARRLWMVDKAECPRGRRSGFGCDPQYCLRWLLTPDL